MFFFTVEDAFSLQKQVYPLTKITFYIFKFYTKTLARIIAIYFLNELITIKLILLHVI